MAYALKSYEEDKPAFRREAAPAKGYTYREYRSWGEDVHCELIDGIPYMMASPGVWHQRVAREVFGQLWDWLKGKKCEVFAAPFDVRLFPPRDGEDGESDKTVVQPDVLVVCDREKLSDGKACKGAPDFVAEVISKGTKGKDFGDKRSLYEKAGVREYWVVDEGEVYKYTLVDGKYRETVHELNEDARIDVDVLPGCGISFGEIVGLKLNP